MGKLKMYGFAFGFIFLMSICGLYIPALFLYVIPVGWFEAINSLYATSAILYTGAFVLSRVIISFSYLIPLRILAAIPRRSSCKRKVVAEPEDKFSRFLVKHPTISWILFIVVALVYSEMLV